METPHIYLGPGDNAPVFEVVLIPPNQEDGSPGEAPDLTGATCTFLSQDRDGTEEVFEVEVPAVSPVDTSGKVTLDFLAMGAEFADGTDYLFRVVVLFADGHQGTFPSGPDPTTGDGTTLTFYLLRVAEGFAVVTP